MGYVITPQPVQNRIDIVLFRLLDNYFSGQLMWSLYRNEVELWLTKMAGPLAAAAHTSEPTQNIMRVLDGVVERSPNVLLHGFWCRYSEMFAQAIEQCRTQGVF